MSEFQKIGIVGRPNSSLAQETIGRLINFLQSKGLETMPEDRCAEVVSRSDGMTRQQLGEQSDLIMVVGGDGSMLHAARDLVDYDVPLLGINRGRLGFLTDIHPDEIETKVTEVLDGRYVITRRFMLECEIVREGNPVGYGTALNDVVLQPTDSIRMIEFDLHIDQQYVYTQRSDGLIVSTPTGSTAYALSGGGPIVHPNLHAIDIVPINPHLLSNRPIVVSGNSKLEVKIAADNEIYPVMVCDGQSSIKAEPGDQIVIRRKNKEIQLLHPVEHDFYETCRSKLHWASR